jgi:hypothetical protein
VAIPTSSTGYVAGAQQFVDNATVPIRRPLLFVFARALNPLPLYDPGLHR